MSALSPRLVDVHAHLVTDHYEIVTKDSISWTEVAKTEEERKHLCLH